MKPIIIAAVMAATPLLMNGFSYTIGYEYDAAGNQISRNVITIKKSANKSKQQNNTIIASEMLADKEIKIYPNPTHGALKVEIYPFEQTDKCEMSISNLSGQMIISISVSEQNTEVDLSNCPDGAYLLWISLNEEETVYKIIKE